MRSISTSRPIRPGNTSHVCSAANAVSSPVTPIGAISNGCSFSSRACGAWSVATQSMVPSARARRSSVTSASVRSGGLTLNTGS